MNFLDKLFIVQSIEETAEGFVARVVCNPQHPVYQAHFPGYPITPGACMLKMAGGILEQKLCKPLFLRQSKTIKYLSVLIPAEGKEIEYRFSSLVEIESECKTQLVIAEATLVYAKMSLIYSYEPL